MVMSDPSSSGDEYSPFLEVALFKAPWRRVASSRPSRHQDCEGRWLEGKARHPKQVKLDTLDGIPFVREKRNFSRCEVESGAQDCEGRVPSSPSLVARSLFRFPDDPLPCDMSSEFGAGTLEAEVSTDELEVSALENCSTECDNVTAEFGILFKKKRALRVSGADARHVRRRVREKCTSAVTDSSSECTCEPSAL